MYVPKQTLPWNKILRAIREEVEKSNVRNSTILKIVSNHSLDFLPLVGRSASIDMNEAAEFLTWAHTLYLMSHV